MNRIANLKINIDDMIPSGPAKDKMLMLRAYMIAYPEAVKSASVTECHNVIRFEFDKPDDPDGE